VAEQIPGREGLGVGREALGRLAKGVCDKVAGGPR
jgi:hypothetical protein